MTKNDGIILNDMCSIVVRSFLKRDGVWILMGCRDYEEVDCVGFDFDFDFGFDGVEGEGKIA